MRRARDSNPQVLADAGFQDRCNSRSASSPILISDCTRRNLGGEGGIRTLDRGYPLCRFSSELTFAAHSCGEGGIRTLDRGYPLCRFSKPVPSATRPPLQRCRAAKLSIRESRSFLEFTEGCGTNLCLQPLGHLSRWCAAENVASRTTSRY